MPAQFQVKDGQVTGLVGPDASTELHFRYPATHSKQLIAYSASLAVDLSLGLEISVAPLTGNITHAVPTNIPADNAEVVYFFVQDGTGSRTITWSASHLGAAPTSGGAANTKLRVEFVVVNGKLIFKSNSGWY